MVYFLENLVAFGLLSLLVWLPGSLLWQLFARSGIERRWQTLVELALGLGSWMALSFFLAATGQLHKTAILFVVFGVTVLAAFVWRKGGRHGLRVPCFSLTPLSISRLWSKLWPGILFAIPLVPIGWLAMSPPVSWDASAYHLTLPKLFIEHGGFRAVDMNVYSQWPLGVELLFALAMLMRDHVLAKLVHFGFGLATLLAIAAGCRRWHRPESGFIAIAFFLANPVVIFELRVANVDLAQAFFTTLAFLLMLESLRSNPISRPHLLLAGICCGLTAAIKVQGIVAAGIIGALMAPRFLSAGTRGDARRGLALFAIPIAVLWIPWLVKAAIATGNPVYPFFFDIFGGPDWSSALEDQLQTWQQSIGMGREPLDYLLLPLRVILLGAWGYDTFDGEIGAFWLVVLPLAIFLSRRQHLASRAMVVAGLFFLFWSLTSQQIRFLVPILPLVSMAAGCVIVDLLDGLRSPRERHLAIAWARAATFALALFYSQASMVAGWRALQRYQNETGDLIETAVPPVDRWIHSNLPADARLLFLNTNQGFFCQREYLADSFFEASQIADWLAPATSTGDLRRLLDARQITHILLDHRDRGIAFPRYLFELLADPSQAHHLWRAPDGRSTLFELR